MSEHPTPNHNPAPESRKRKGDADADDEDVIGIRVLAALESPYMYRLFHVLEGKDDQEQDERADALFATMGEMSWQHYVEYVPIEALQRWLRSGLSEDEAYFDSYGKTISTIILTFMQVTAPPRSLNEMAWEMRDDMEHGPLKGKCARTEGVSGDQ